jgi:hypothetical protein
VRAEVDAEMPDATPDVKALAVQARVGIALNDPNQPTIAHQLARVDDPFLVPRMVPHQDRIDAIDEHALATAFHEMAKFPPPPPPDSTVRQREAIGRALGEYLTNARHGEDADMVALRAVAALGPVEVHVLADVLGKWAGAFSTIAYKMEQMGLKK